MPIPFSHYCSVFLYLNAHLVYMNTWEGYLPGTIHCIDTGNHTINTIPTLTLSLTLTLTLSLTLTLILSLTLTLTLSLTLTLTLSLTLTLILDLNFKIEEVWAYILPILLYKIK